MNIKELEDKIKEEKTKLTALEESCEKEEDEMKISKLQYGISRKYEVINRLIDRQNSLLDKENNEVTKEGNGKDKEEEEEDADICSECGGDLKYVGDDGEGNDVFACEQCNELFVDV